MRNVLIFICTFAPNSNHSPSLPRCVCACVSFYRPCDSRPYSEDVERIVCMYILLGRTQLVLFYGKNYFHYFHWVFYLRCITNCTVWICKCLALQQTWTHWQPANLNSHRSTFIACKSNSKSYIGVFAANAIAIKCPKFFNRYK